MSVEGSVGEVKLGAWEPRCLASPLRASLFHVTDFYRDAPLKFLHTQLSGALQKCFQSSPALAEAGPAYYQWKCPKKEDAKVNKNTMPRFSLINLFINTQLKWQKQGDDDIKGKK